MHAVCVFVRTRVPWRGVVVIWIPCCLRAFAGIRVCVPMGVCNHGTESRVKKNVRSRCPYLWSDCRKTCANGLGCRAAFAGVLMHREMVCSPIVDCL